MNEELSKLLQEDKMAEQYFSSLPVHIQETIQQTGMKMQSVEEPVSYTHLDVYNRQAYLFGRYISGQGLSVFWQGGRRPAGGAFVSESGNRGARPHDPGCTQPQSVQYGCAGRI